MTFLKIGKPYTEGNESAIIKEADSLTWETLPISKAPMGQGMAIQGIIDEWKMPAKRVAMFGMFSGFAMYGIETNKQQIFFIDEGVAVVPIGLRDKP